MTSSHLSPGFGLSNAAVYSASSEVVRGRVPYQRVPGRRLESAPTYVERCTTRLAYPKFELVHGHYPDACFSREVLLVPFKESPRWIDGSTRKLQLARLRAKI